MKTDEQFVIFCNCIRPSTGTKMTIRLPAEITADTMVDYIGNEFDWQFIPLGVQAVPVDQINPTDDIW